MKETLLHKIQTLKEKKADYQKTARELFNFEYQTFNEVFDLDNISVEKGTYLRIPAFFNEKCCAMLMLWGSNNHTAIHDHLDYNGLIKVLKGSLTELNYSENKQFITFDKESNASEGTIFPEDLGGIHSVINKSEGLSVSLHVYHTPQTSLKGVRIFDIENKRVAYLNEKASSCSWYLPKDSYDKIIQI